MTAPTARPAELEGTEMSPEYLGTIERLCQDLRAAYEKDDLRGQYNALRRLKDQSEEARQEVALAIAEAGSPK